MRNKMKKGVVEQRPDRLLKDLGGGDGHEDGLLDRQLPLLQE